MGRTQASGRSWADVSRSSDRLGRIRYALQVDDEEDLGDLLLELLPPDGSTMGNLSAREALSKATEREIRKEVYEEVKERLVALGLVRKGRGRAKKEAPAKDFKAVLRASADKLRAQMDAAQYKHLVLSPHGG
jgi:hypothetical protein